MVTFPRTTNGGQKRFFVPQCPNTRHPHQQIAHHQTPRLALVL